MLTKKNQRKWPPVGREKKISSVENNYGRWPWKDYQVFLKVDNNIIHVIECYCMLAEKSGTSYAEPLDDCIILFDESDNGDDGEEDDPLIRQEEEEVRKENVKPVVRLKKTEKQSRGTQ